MRQFYIAFPNRHALSDQLSWTHFRILLKIDNEKARDFHLLQDKSGFHLMVSITILIWFFIIIS